MTYIAFLRGINVGTHKVTMAELRGLFEQLGLRNVRSYIASGNIFFETDSRDRQTLQHDIENQLKQALGYEVPTFLREIVEIEAIVARNPFKNIELTAGERFCVLFTDAPLDESLVLPMHSSKNDMDIVAINTHEAFVVWHIVNGRPPSGTFAASVIPPKNTSRFYHTLVKILAAAKA